MKKKAKTKRKATPNTTLLQAQLDALDAIRREQDGRLALLEENYELTRTRLAQYREMLGPIWKQQSGHLTCPALMSDNHLENMMRDGYGGVNMRDAIVAEQRRRAEDDRWHAHNGKVSPRLQLAKLAQLEVLFGSLKLAHEQTQRRISEVWARVGEFTEIQRVVQALKHLLR